MGQDICSNVTLSQDFCPVDEKAANQILVPSQLEQFSPISPAAEPNNEINVVSSEEIGLNVEEESQVCQVQLHRVEENPVEVNILKEIAELRKKFSDKNAPKQIYLSTDKVWESQMKQTEYPIDSIYKKMGDNKFLRYGHDNKKYQVLFRQHFPMFGIFFYEIQIQSYMPNKGCDFIIGVANYLQATKKLHSRGTQLEESFTFKLEKDLKADANEVKVVNIKLKFEINRESNMINFYVNNELAGGSNEPKKLKSTLTMEVASLAPYIQTQFVGITFSWKLPPLAKSASYRMSTIIEEESSIQTSL